MKKARILYLVALLGCNVNAATLHLSPTFENCSVAVRNAPETTNIAISFRPVVGTEPFRPALPLVRLPDPNRVRNWTKPEQKLIMPYDNGEWRGSLFHLRENTEYEVAVTLQPTAQTLTGRFKTGNSAIPKISRTIFLEDFPSDQPIRLKELNGTADHYIRITMRHPETPLTDKKRPRASVVEIICCSYLIIENINLSGGNNNTLRLEDVHHIRILNSEFSEFGRSTGQDLSGAGNYLGPGGGILRGGGINCQNVHDMLIERCYIHTPGFTANCWFFSHPFGPMAIRTGDMKGNVVLRYNDFAGSYRRRYDDVVGGGSNGSPTGGFARDADIYGNYFINSNDDSIELDGGQSNVRLYYNRMVGSFCAVSTAPCIVGPSYIFGNLVHDMGDENNQGPGWLKTKFGDIGVGRIFYIGNTAPGLTGGNHGPHSDPEYTRLFTRNNVLPASRPVVAVKSDLDYDLFDKPNRNRKIEKHGQYATIRFVAADSGTYRLSPHSAGTQSAIKVDNLWEYPKGDLGAFPLPSSPELPYRPIDVKADQSKICFTSPNQLGPLSVKMTNNSAGNLPFMIRKSPDADYFSVQPTNGVIPPGGNLELLVTVHPDKLTAPARYTDAFFIRFRNGFSCPVTVVTDLRKSPSHLAAKKDFLQIRNVIQGDNQGQWKLTADGAMQLTASPGDQALVFNFEVPEDGVYYFFAQWSTTGAEKDLFEYSLGDNLFGRNKPGIGYNPRPYTIEAWRRLVRVNSVPWKDFEAFKLKKGVHTLRIRPLKPFQLRAVALTSNYRIFYR